MKKQTVELGEWVRIRDVSRMLALTPNTVYKLIEAGVLVSARFGFESRHGDLTCTRVSKKSLAEFVERRTRRRMSRPGEYKT